MQFDTISQKIQNRCNLPPCEDENYSGFHFAAFIENGGLYIAGYVYVRMRNVFGASLYTSTLATILYATQNTMAAIPKYNVGNLIWIMI